MGGCKYKSELDFVVWGGGKRCLVAIAAATAVLRKVRRGVVDGTVAVVRCFLRIRFTTSDMLDAYA